MFGKSAVTNAAGKQYANAFANMDDMEDDFQDQDYGDDYYDEEDQSMDDAVMRSQLAKQHQMAAMQQSKQPAYSGPGSKPIGTNLFAGANAPGQFGAQQFGQGSLSTQFGANQFGGGTQFGQGGLGTGSGGFTYGMASSGPGTFGPPTNPIGSKPQSAPIVKPAPITGGFAFGSASQFGGVSGGNTFGSGQFNAIGGQTANDPYANVDLDLSKVKTVTIPQKPFEKKSEEEKVEAKNQLQNKSNLKTTKEDFDKGKDNKKEVKFGKSITYQVNDDDEPSILSNKERKVIGEKDLSDGRDEKEKIKMAMEAEENKQLEERKAMNEWKAKQTAKAAAEASALKKPVAKVPVVDIESSNNSSSVGGSGRKEIADSYTSDDFEDSSITGSGSQSKDSQSKLVTLNKVQQKTVTKPLKKIEESSDVYEDDDFESLSRSQQQMNQILPVNKQSVKPLVIAKNLPTINKPIITAAPVVRKENQNTMTDLGKYNYSLDPTSGATTLKEMSLKRQLDDSEIIVSEQRIAIQKARDENKELELKLKQKDTEFQGQRREALNATETNNRMTEQMKELHHRTNLYRVEVEELLKQIDMADAKTREREDQLCLKEAEFERKLKAIEERILYKRGKNEEREILDNKREHAIQLEEIMRKYEEMREENDYLKTKVAKLEEINKQLRLSKDPKDQTKQLESEVQFLQQQLMQFQKGKIQSKDEGIKKELSLVDQIRIQKELAQADLIIKGYQEENLKAETKVKEVNSLIKTKDKEVTELRKQVHELQIQKMLGNEKVYVEQKNEEVDIETANVMGPSNSISQKQLKELQDTVMQLRYDNDALKRDWTSKEQSLKILTNKVRDEKTQVEKQLYQSEFLVQEKNSEIQKIRDDYLKDRLIMEDKVKELTDKVAWFRKNQSLLTDQEQHLAANAREITDLKTALKKAEELNLKQKDYEKQCNLLKETLKAKNPQALEMINKTSTLAPENQNEKQLKYRIQQLEGELDERDKDFERRMRAMRQEQERMRAQYEERAQNPTEAKKVNELEQELQRTKTYYHNRIRELEDKYKFKVNIGKADEVTEIKQVVLQKQNNKEQIELAQHEQIVKELKEDKGILIQRLQQSVQKCTQLEAQLNTKLNPFFVEETVIEDRSVAQLLKALQEHKLTLSKYQNKQIKISELRQIIQSSLTESELNKVANYLSEQNDNATQKGVVDISDLLDQFGSTTPGSASPEQKNKVEPRNEEYQELKRGLNRLQREKEDDSDFFNNKIRQLKRQLQQATVEKEEMEEHCKQLEGQKARLEKFLKTGLSKGQTNEELIQDVNFVMRRLEVLEQQAEERAQLLLGDQMPIKRKLEMLQQELIEERNIRDRVIQKKNSEVAYFKKELESLLDEIAKKKL